MPSTWSGPPAGHAAIPGGIFSPSKRTPSAVTAAAFRLLEAMDSAQRLKNRSRPRDSLRARRRCSGDPMSGITHFSGIAIFQ